MGNQPKRIVFMGSPAFAVPSLQALVAAGNTVVAVYTQPPRPAGRGNQLQKTAIHTLAESLNLPVFTPEKLREDALKTLMDTPCDCICVVAYGLLLPRVVVESRTCLNVHPSALPRWRGPAPLQHALMAGDASTEVCIMKLEAGMDTGPVYTRTPVEIPLDMRLATLHDTAAALGAKELVNVVATLAGRTPTPQTGEATLAPKITAELRSLNWEDSALALHNRVRGLSPAPGAVGLVAGELVKILETAPLPGTPAQAPGTVLATHKDGIDIACGQGILRIITLQRPGSKALPAADVARGWKELQS